MGLRRRLACGGGAALAAGAAALARPGAALAHGTEDILLFSYLAEEPGLLRISAAFLGGVLLLLGAFIAWQGWGEWARQRRAAPAAKMAPQMAVKMTAPGLFIAGVGVAVLLAAAFVLPERLRPRHAHPEAAAAKAPAPPAGKPSVPRRPPK